MQEFAEVILAGMDRGFRLLNGRMDNFEARLAPMEKDVATIKSTIGEMQLEIAGALKATDQHAVKLIAHDKRIGRLEKRMA